jgi:hypothetical protein
MAESSRLCSFLLIALAAGMAITAVYLKDTDKYKGVDNRIKVIHLIENVLFYTSGAWYGTDRFNRFFWDIAQIKVGPGSGGILGADGITSVDLDLPSVWKQDNSSVRVPIRLYYPEYLTSAGTEEKKRLPVLLYFHGGGFVFISNDDLFYDM